VSLTLRVLVGLVTGFLLGLALANTGSPSAPAIVAAVTPIGTIFVNLIRMTVLPLVVAMLVASVGSVGASGALGRASGRAAVIAVALLGVTALGSLLVAQPVLSRIQIDPAAAMALRGPMDAVPKGPVTPAGTSAIAQWLIDLVPQNVFKAAADGAILPVIVFAVLFALALTRVTAARRAAVLSVVEGIADAMQRLVAWILALAPVGVFALAVPLASRLGLAAVGAVFAYVVLVVSLTVAAGAIVLYPVAVAWGAMSARQFIAFCAPAQAVAFASRSSLAALPAMVESAERANLPPVVSGFILPLAASVFRVGAAVAQTVGVLFLSRLYGVALSPAQLASIVVTVILTSFAVPGVPGGSIIAIVPVLAAANLPVDGVGILLAVDTIPDMFRTTENVTGSMVLAAILGRSAAEDRSLRSSSY
jgi:proton glutamate symport protein